MARSEAKTKLHPLGTSRGDNFHRDKLSTITFSEKIYLSRASSGAAAALLAHIWHGDLTLCQKFDEFAAALAVLEVSILRLLALFDGVLCRLFLRLFLLFPLRFFA